MSAYSIDVVLWDWNGTLLDDGDFGRDIINRILQRRGMRVPSREEHGQLFDFPVQLYYQRLGFDFEKEPFEGISQEFVDDYYAGVRDCSLRPGSRDTLQLLGEQGLTQSILSASRQDHLETLIAHFDLQRFFDELLGIDSVHAPGKSGRGLEWIEEKGFDPQCVVLIGDTVHDAEVADKMGIHCLLLQGGHHPVQRLLETGKSVLPSISHVQEALTRLGCRTISA